VNERDRFVPLNRPMRTDGAGLQEEEGCPRRADHPRERSGAGITNHMIALHNISKQFGRSILFRDFSFQVGDGDRIAIVGSNGAGKSTLMKIIAGQIEADAGTIRKSRYSTTGYLPQDGVYHEGMTLYDEVETVFATLTSLHGRIEEIGREIRELNETDALESPRMNELMRELETAQTALEQGDAYHRETRIKRILFGLGFSDRDLRRRTEEFSGGWHMRIELAKLLLMEPTVLLLDEPTNHLDIESLEWIEAYLRTYQGAILLVSHDSRFLDNVVDKVIEISLGRVSEYTGNYTSYLKQKSQRLDILEATRRHQERALKKTERFIERFRYKNTKARQVQSRVKMLEKMQPLTTERDEKTIAFAFPEPPRAGRVVMELREISKAYNDIKVLEDASLHVERGDRIAIIGINGSGKSTLARIVAGIETMQQGERCPGHNATISYYAQNKAEELDPDKTVLQTLDEAAPLQSSGALRSLLGCFLFSDDDVFKPVSVLSGGEKSRLALAKMLLKPSNLMIMDEPTNHLDIRSKGVLQESLAAYTGAYLIVSHDRDFLAPLINKVVTIRDKTVILHHGSVDDYLEKLHAEERSRSNGADRASGEAPVIVRNRKREEAEKRQERYRKLKPLKESLAAVERDIEEAEGRKQEIEEAFADQATYNDEKRVRTLNIEHAQLVSRLDELYTRWTALEEEVIAISDE